MAEKKVQENTNDISAQLPYFPWGQYGNDLYNTAPAWGFYDAYGAQSWLSRRDNRMVGEVLPIHITWMELKKQRDECRRIAATNEYAQACIQSYQNYCVSTGFVYSAHALEDDVDPAMLKQVNQLLSLFVEHNQMSEIENEICYRLHVEGEVFLRMFPNYEDGLLRVRFIEPELVRSPNDDNSPLHSYGIECTEDIHTVLGYWVIERPWESMTPTLVPAKEILHIKNNATNNQKRGTSTLWSIQSNLRNAEDVQASLISIARARAKFAAIKTVENAPPEAIQALGATSTDAVITDPLTNQKSNIAHYGYGTVLSLPSTVKMEFPSLAIGSSDLIETLQVNLRSIAVRFGITETMISGDASNNNYASALVAEAPAVKSFKRFGKMMASYLGERRTQPQRSLVWEQLILATKIGLLPAEILNKIVIKVQMPSVETRDQNLEAQVNKTYHDLGIKSKSTIASELGVNWEQERKNIDMENMNKGQPDEQTGDESGDS